jgi:hypothetical protein
MRRGRGRQRSAVGGEGDGGDGGMKFGDFEILRKMAFLKGGKGKVFHGCSFGFFFFFFFKKKKKTKEGAT